MSGDHAYAGSRLDALQAMQQRNAPSSMTVQLIWQLRAYTLLLNTTVAKLVLSSPYATVHQSKINDSCLAGPQLPTPTRAPP